MQAQDRAFPFNQPNCKEPNLLLLSRPTPGSPTYVHGKKPGCCLQLAVGPNLLGGENGQFSAQPELLSSFKGTVAGWGLGAAGPCGSAAPIELFLWKQLRSFAAELLYPVALAPAL